MNAIVEKLNSAGSLFVNFSAVMLVQASILILILLALDFILRKKVRAVFRYCIWMLVLVKLIIPPSISSPVSIGNLFGNKLSEIKIDRAESPGRIEQAGTIIKVPQIAISEPKPELYKQIDPAGTRLKGLEWQKERAKIVETSTAELEEQQKPVMSSVFISWQGTAFLAWAIVLLILILLLIQRAMFVRGLVAQADEITGGLNDLVQSCGRLLGMKGKVKLKTSSNTTSPAVCGLFRPVILIPQNLAPNLTKEQLKAVLLHELVHIKRGDLWINLFQALLQVAYFYNPLVWLANAIIRRVREQAVDEAVQVALGESAESYPQILVNVAKLAFKKPALSLRLIGVVEKKSALKNRIARMLSRPIPKKAKLGIIGLISVFLVAAVLLPMAKAQKENATDETGVQKPQFKAELNNNVTVELVGVCEHPSEGKQWWRPDGSILSQAPYHTTGDRSTSEKEGYVYYEFALELNQPDVSYYWMIPGSGHGSDTGSPQDKEGHRIGSLKAYATNLPREQKSATVRIGATAAEWQTVGTHKPQNNEQTVTVDEFAIAFGIPYEQQKRTLLPVVHNYNRRERKFAIRVVAITKSGQVRKSGVSGSGGGQLNSMTYIFDGLALDEIKKFQFQTRTYEWMEFKNVSLKPNFKTNVKIEIEEAAEQDSTEESSENAKEVVLPDSSEDVIFDMSRGEFIRLPVDSAEQAREFLDEKERGDVLYDYDDSNKPRIGFYKGVIYGHPWQMEDGFAAVRFEKEELPITFVVQLRNREKYTITVVIAEENACRITYKRLKIPAGQDEGEEIENKVEELNKQAREDLYQEMIRKNPREFAETYLEALKNEDWNLAASMCQPGSKQARNAHLLGQICDFNDSKIDTVYSNGEIAIAVTKQLKQIDGRQWQLGISLTKEEKSWMIKDIDWLPTGRELEFVSQFKGSFPNAKTIEKEETNCAGQDEMKETSGMIGQNYCFGPIIEITINDNVSVGVDSLIDFDTGKLFSLPEDWLEKSRDAMFSWLVERGIDAVGATRASVKGLMCEDMIIEVAPGGDSYWDKCQPEQLAELDLWEIGKAGRPAYMTAQNTVPVTYIFKTREGGIGILQIIGFEDEPRCVNIRYKMIQESAKLVEKSTGIITGKVLDGDNKPVADAIVLICEKQTGIPLADDDYVPFTKGYLQGQQKKPAFATTDNSGSFSFKNLPQGKYRLIAQSWPGIREVSDIFEVKSPIVNLNGTADNIDIAAGKTVQVVIKPLGTGSLMINQDMPNDESCSVFSTSPTRADPILGFAGWTGDFLQNMLGANRMPGGRTIVNGLPEGKIYIAMFAADSVPGWTVAQADIKANRTTGLPYVPFVNSWSNSRHEPPEELVPIFDEIRSLTSTQQNLLLMNSYKAVGLEPSEDGGIWGFMAEIIDYLEKPVELPSGRKAAFGEVMAAAQYIQLQRAVESKNKRIARQNEQSRKVQDSTQANSETQTESNLQQLIDSARSGQTVAVPEGIYTEPIVINKSLRLKGEDANSCIIEVTANEPAVFVDTKGKGVVTIENLTIKWQLATSDVIVNYPFAVTVKDSTAQIKNCNFVPLGNYQRSPVALRAQGFTNMDVNNCRFDGYNYTIQFGEGTEGILQNSIITNSGHQGVINYSGSTLRVKGNIITGSKFHAVRCTGGKLYVEDNLLINNENRGIYLGNKSASGAITNNIIMGNGTNISGFARSQVSITNNIIADSSYAGISMRDSCRLLIADNIFLKNGRGIILHEEAGKNTNRISENTFWKNAVNFENIEQFATPVETEPSFADPNNGDFSIKSGPVREQNQGLKKPEVFKALWKKFKKLELVGSDL